MQRDPDPDDRRARIVRLTTAGRARQAAAQADIRAMESEMLAGLSPAEQAMLRALLAGLAGRAG